MRRAFLALMAAATFSTGCPPPEPCGAPAPAPTPVDAPAWFHDTGEVRLVFPAPPACGEGSSASSAQATVVDARNRQVEHTLSFQPGEPGAATVAFTPRSTGAFHVTVTFLPFGARAQRQALIVHDRRDAKVRTVPRACATLLALPSGLLGCDDEGFLPDGGRLPFAPGARAASEGQVVWSHDAGSLLRFTEADGALTLRGVSAPFTFPVDVLHARADEAFAIGPGSVYRFQAELDGGVRFGGSVRRGDGPASELALLRGERFLYAATPQPSSTPVEAPGTEARVCAHPIESGLLAADGGSCASFKGEPLGSTAEGLWTWDARTRTLRLLAPEVDGALVVIDALALPAGLGEPQRFPSFQHARRPLLLPKDGWEVFAPRLEGAQLVIDHFVLPQGALQGAHSQLLWVSDGQRTHAVRLDDSPP